MPPHITPRQPLSCENCRKRKIKCTSGPVPCATCVKRGHGHTCFYKRNADQAQQGNPEESELLSRIRNLEDLLKQQIAQSSQSPTGPAPDSTPTRSEDAFSYTGSDAVSVKSKFRQTGTIVTSSSGYQRFAPWTSALDVNLVHELVESVPSPLCTSNFPFSSDSISARNTLLDMLPPLRQCDELKSVFLEVFSPLFHVLHDPTFEVAYERFRLDPSNVPLSWLALLFVALAIAVTALDEDHPLLRDLGREASAGANIKKLSAKYRGAAMSCLTADEFLYQHNLQTVQTLVLLIYAMNHANISSWALLGMTWNIAVRIGCHVDPSRLGLEIVEAEERRRCWAALMMLYTIQNTCLGNITPHIVTANVDLPADRDDDELRDSPLEHDGAVQIHNRPSKMSYILYKFRLYKIAAEICQHALDGQLAEPQTMFRLDQKLAVEEHEHTSRFSRQNLPIYHIAHHYILQSYCQHLYLILHRSSLNARDVAEQVLRQSRQRCKTSATTILEVHAHLYETTEFRPYQWYVYGLGSFHAFLAVSVLIVLRSSSTSSDDDAPRLDALIEQCVQRFEIMANRSEVCARAVVILRRVLLNSNKVTAMPANVARSDGSMLQQGIYNFPISPVSNPELSMAGYDRCSNPDLDALLFDMAPQQWMAPSSFTWDRWNNMVLV